MIWESSYWREDLLRRAAELRRRPQQRRWPESSFGKLEQCVMIGFYGVRKLIEARKLSVRASGCMVDILRHAPKGTARITRLNRLQLDEHYDLAQPLSCSKPLEFVCNQFIHSYVFAPFFDEDGCLDSLVVASDWERSKNLYRVSILRVAEVFESVAKDATTSTTFTWDASMGDYKVEHV